MTDQPWRPGLNVIRMAGLPSWTPCLTRVCDDDGRPTAREHAWFLDVTSTLYCWECRRVRARCVFGPEARIAEIRDALAAGDRALVDELVRRLSRAAAANDGEVHAATRCGEPVGVMPASELCLALRDPDDWAEYFAERAAVFEFLGGMPRQVAEARARQLAGPMPRMKQAR